MAKTDTEEFRGKSVEQLIAMNTEVSAEKDSARNEFIERQEAINSEINRRTASDAMEKYLAGLTPDMRRAVLAGLSHQAKEG